MGREKDFVWMVYDREGLGRNRDYVSLYQQNCRRYDLEVRAVYDTETRQRIRAGERPLCAFVRTICPEVNRSLEAEKIPTFNPYSVSRICNDKGLTLEYLKNDVPAVPSITLAGEELLRVMEMDVSEAQRYFRENFAYSVFAEWEEEQIRQAEDFVLKTVDGHGGSEVYSFCRERKEIGERVRERRMVLQPMVAAHGGQVWRDIRVYVIGRRIVAAVMRSSTEDFRANFSRGGQVRLCELTPSQEEAVNRITGKFDFGMVGIDFLFDREECMVLNEIEDVVGARMLYQCAPGLDIVKEYLAYVMEHI